MAEFASKFSGFRTPPAPALYGEIRSAVTADVVEIALIVSFVIVLFSVLLSSIGILDKRKKVSSVIGASVVGYFFICMLLSIFGFGWRAGSLKTETAYRQFTNQTIHAKVGLHIGLYSVNITLKGEPIKQLSEDIDYNEHFNFGVLQGRIGFGSQAGLVSQEFRSAQFRGIPNPILWIAEYFTIDGEQIRWGRQYRQAGYYTALLMWTALAFFFLTVLTATWTLAYSACLSFLTGVLLLMACLTYSLLYNMVGPPLKIPFEDGVLETTYGWSFILTLINGLLLCVLGIVMMVLYLFFPDIVLDLLDIDLNETDEIVLIDEEPPNQVAPAGPKSVSPVTSDIWGTQTSDSFTSVVNRRRVGSMRTLNGFQIKRRQRSRRSRREVAASQSEPADEVDSAVFSNSLATIQVEPEQEQPLPEKGYSVCSQDSSPAELAVPGGGMQIRRKSMELLQNAMKQPIEYVTRIISPKASVHRAGSRQESSDVLLKNPNFSFHLTEDLTYDEEDTGMP
ncbi:dual oxidase maturation factor 1-like [Sycon ciliatum]|uniref:dual oxidase maturation factor 1-like n=1 Tax=Sycon ciliatum TaxID=27933 RepID=UPI0031F5FC55